MNLLLMSTLLCFAETFLSPLYIVLSFTALLSLVVPMLRDLSAHGKTRAPLRLNKQFLSTLVLPKSWFTHFYIVGICMVVLLVWYAPEQIRNRAAVALLVLHLMRRTFECLHVHAWNDASTMHVAGYLLGILHYSILPLVFADFCGYNDAYGEWVSSGREGTSTMRQCCGVCVCLWGQYEQFRHHVILADLRLKRSTTTKYSIPYGGWFRYVSCPHYLAEIVVYGGFVILLLPVEPASLSDQDNKNYVDRLLLSSRAYRSLVLLVWVMTNLSVSAINSHLWYMRTFPSEYPPLHRKAIIPYIL
jgi:3-oxo-5-alpha-steroid 4-dehydrogenase 3